MEEVTRGFVESLMDDMLKEDLVEDIKWVPNTIPITSMRELAIGYVIGLLDGIGSSIWGVAEPRKRITQQVEERFTEMITSMIRRRLPEIIEKVDAELNR